MDVKPAKNPITPPTIIVITIAAIVGRKKFSGELMRL